MNLNAIILAAGKGQEKSKSPESCAQSMWKRNGKSRN